jgi:hypothetical protein
MLAAPSRGAATRFDRAKNLARDLGRGLPGIPIGVSSLTDRVLPHLFPTPDHGTFFATLERVVGVERPPPSGSFATVATTLGALSAVATRGFFSPAAKKRAVVVLTDAETQPVVPARLAALFRRRPAIETFFVHVWDGAERIYAGGVPEPGYLPDPTSPDTIRRLAEGVEGRAFDEDDDDGLIDAVRDVIGSEGETRRIEEKEKFALAPYVMAGALVPLAFILGRRNL